MPLNPHPAPNHDFDQATIDFLHWCGERLHTFPEPPQWHAMMAAKEAFLKGHAVMIWHEHIEGTFYQTILCVDDDPTNIEPALQ